MASSGWSEEDIMRQMARAQQNAFSQQQGLLGQAGLGGLQQRYQRAACVEALSVEKPKLGLDKGEKARDYLQRKVNGWLSGVELP